MSYRPLGANELNEICRNCGWPLGIHTQYDTEGETYTDIPGVGRVFIILPRKEDLRDSHVTGRYREEFILRISAGVDDTMLKRLVPEIWTHLEAITPPEIKWGAISSAVGGGIELWTWVKRTDAVIANARIHEMFRLKKHLEETVKQASVSFVQLLLNVPQAQSNPS